ncbi:hypothetical protein [Schlesneria paludicola]|uniref:hypothetical protein n=1 Tax=Schlesneria paludicola TaxID=360056 RepID=UPI00029AC168|nr:hypothetical protein [Schlesneria paludicola]
MGNRSQRQKERHEKKRQEKRKKQEQSRGRAFENPRNGGAPLGSNARHRERLSKQIPRAWAGETVEDVAVFDDSVLATLPPDVAQQVSLVREVLHEATESRGEEAVTRLSVISRSSPLSEWRLFIRGLVDWLADDTEAASEAWKRLDTERRPGRIATAMMIALRSDLEQTSPPAANGESADADPVASPAIPLSRCDDQLLYHGKLLRRVRFDRAALRVAEAGVNMPEESNDLVLGPRKFQWLKQFFKEYGDTEPDLIAALSQTALGRTFVQNFHDLFDEVVRSLPGPRHDRQNRLLTYFFYSRFQNDPPAEKTAKRSLNQYLNHDLPQNMDLTEALRGAIASQIHFQEAKSFMQPDGGGEMLPLRFRPVEDSKSIRTHLQAALKADPKNRPVHKTYSNWLDSKLDDENLTQAKRKPFEEELADVMRGWSQSLPEDIEPRLWLVDYLLENDQLEEARPHVDSLAASRIDDPRVRATPWKWQLLEAMRLSRRKAWLVDVPARLDAAESLWPAWLSKQWLPYLRAAWMLRSGQAEAFEIQRQQICQASGLTRGSLPDACMMLGAAQQMRLSAEELKPLRLPVDQAVKKLHLLSLEELLETGSFFWDLQRTRLLYPAYRMHGANIGKELIARLAKPGKQGTDFVTDERVHKVVLWGSECRFWPSGNQIRLAPFFFKPDLLRHPMFVAARLNAFLKERYQWDTDTYRELGPLLREAAPSQRDAYYRHWFLVLADELDDLLDANSSLFGFPFGTMFGSDDDDDGNDFEDNDRRFDPDCNCGKCQAARKAAEQARSTDSATPF